MKFGDQQFALGAEIQDIYVLVNYLKAVLTGFGWSLFAVLVVTWSKRGVLSW